MYIVNTALVDTAIRNLPPFIKGQVLDALEDLKSDPYHAHNAIRMTGGYRGFYRCKVGDYRILYDVQEKYVTVLILKIAKRRNVYQDGHEAE